MARPRKPCDGTANDYFRHIQRGEEACERSKRARAAAMRRWRATGMHHGKLPYVPEDDQHIYPATPERKAKAARFNANGKRPYLA